MSDYIKPSGCDCCLAAEKSRSTIVCGCMRTLIARIDNQNEKLLMWRNCPLGWKQRRDNGSNM